jgi:hypothetical protein
MEKEEIISFLLARSKGSLETMEFEGIHDEQVELNKPW